MSGIKLKCSECGTTFENTNINIRQNQAFCQPCGLLYPLDEIQRNSTDTSYKVQSTSIDGILEYQDDKGYSIEITWRNFSLYKFHLIFGGIVTLFTLPLSVFLLFKMALMGVAICGLFAIVGLYLLHMGLQEYFNTSMLFIDASHFTVYHQPFGLFLKKVHIPKSHIDQFYTKKISAGSSNGTEHFKHELWLDDKDGASIKVLSLFKEEREAFHVEHLLEKKLSIKDVLKSGEHQPGAAPNLEIPIRFMKAMQKVKNERSN